VALLLGALWYESGWLIRLVALAVMLELSFCEFALRRTRRVFCEAGDPRVRQPASADRFLPMPPWAVFARPAMLQEWRLPGRKRLSGCWRRVGIFGLFFSVFCSIYDSPNSAARADCFSHNDR